MVGDDEAQAVAEARARAVAEGVARFGAVQGLARAIARAHPDDAAALMVAALEDIGAGMPEVDHWRDRLREDAAFWADTARPDELEAYVAAGLRRLGDTPMGERMRKRLLVSLWQTMPEGWRAEFMARVDPAGAFRGAA